MNRYYPYRTIREKLDQVQGPDTGELWNGMKAILDREMPEKEERKGFYWWFLTPRGMSVAAVSSAIIIITCMLQFGSSPEIDPATGKLRVPGKSNQPNPSSDESAQVAKSRQNVPAGPADNTYNNVSGQPVSVVPEERIPASVSDLQQTNTSSSGTGNRKADAVTKSEKSATVRKTVSSGNNSVSVFSSSAIRNKDAGRKNSVVKADLAPGKGTNKPAADPGRKTDQTSEASKNNVDAGKNNVLVNSGIILPAGDNKEIIKTTSEEGIGNRQNEAETEFYYVRRRIDPLPELRSDSLKSQNTIPDPAKPLIEVPKPVEIQKKGFVAGASINMNVPLSSQEMSTISTTGRKISLFDYLPSVYGQYHFNNKLFVQAELQANSPQYTPNFLLARAQTYQSQTRKQVRTLELKKLYYINLPVSVHYSPIRNVTVGMGIQYGYLHKTVFLDQVTSMENRSGNWQETSTSRTVAVNKPSKAKKEQKKLNQNNGGSAPTNVTMSLPDTVATTFQTSDWRVFADVNYKWNRLNAGLRFNRGLNPYINTHAGNNVLQVRDKNESLQFYIRFDLLDLRKRKRR